MYSVDCLAIWMDVCYTLTKLSHYSVILRHNFSTKLLSSNVMYRFNIISVEKLQMTFSLVDHKSCTMAQSLDTISDFFKIISYHNYAVSCISELPRKSGDFY